MDQDVIYQIDEENEMYSQSSQQNHIHSEVNSAGLTGHCNESHDDQYYLEMFHRAMVNQEPDAWELLQRCFSPVVRAWMRNHPRRNLACRYELEENYVANAFTRVRQASKCNRLEFDSLVAALSYLKLSLQGTILDTLRAYTQPREVSLPDADSATYSSEKPAIKDDYKSSDLWEIIKSLLHDERERQVAYLLFHCGLKPREIVRYHSNEFGEVQEIIRLRRNIMERLIYLCD
jgi:ribonuclease HI